MAVVLMVDRMYLSDQAVRVVRIEDARVFNSVKDVNNYVKNARQSFVGMLLEIKEV